MERNAWMSDEPTNAREPAEPREASAGDGEDLAAYLDRMAFPAGREEMLELLTGMHAPQDVLEEIRKLPEGAQFDDAEEVWEAVGG
jgi:Protein of unknown function (DUF2795)